MYRAGENIVVFDEQQKLVAKITDPAMMRDARNIPGLLYRDLGSQLLVEMPWHEDSCRILQNLGVNATLAAPLMRSPLPDVEGKYRPMAHQAITAAFMTLNPRSFVLSDPRTGKTGSLILAMDYLQRHRMVTGGFLIITTVTTMPSVWAQALQDTLPKVKVQIVHGKTREKSLRTPADFYVTNYDSCRISKNAFLEAVQEGRIGGCVIDELTHVGNASSQRHKAIASIVRGLNYVIGATGSPGNNPDAIFGMCMTINPSALPCRTKGAWLNLTTYQWGMEPFQRSLKDDAPEIFHKAMQPAIRFAKKDIMDLPPVTVQDRDCNMSKEQRLMWDQFTVEAMALTSSGETITAANGGVLFQKLMQVGQGFVMGNDGKPNFLEHKDRTQAILDVIAETDRKVVIFGIYKAANAQLVDELRGSGYSVELIDGDVTGTKRAEILDRFATKKDPHVLVAHPITTSYGVDLAVADTMILNGPPVLGSFVYAQLVERLSSNKQTASNVNIVRIVSTPEERRAYRSLEAGHKAGAVINELFENLKGAAA